MGGSGTLFTKQDIGDVFAVNDPVAGSLGLGQLCQGGKQVGGDSDFFAYAPCRNGFRPPDERGHPHVSFVFAPSFCPPQWTTAHAAGWAVVGGENHQRVMIQLEILQGLQDAPDAVVHFLHVGAVNVPLRTFEVLGPGIAWGVDMGMGDITKERPLLIFLNERNRFVGDDFRQQ